MRTGILLCVLLCVGVTSWGSAATVCDQGSCRTEFDRIPRFDLPVTLATVKPGRWSDPATWTTGIIPGADSRVQILHAVEFDAPDGQALVVGILAGGHVTFTPTTPTRLTVETLFVLPGGKLTRLPSIPAVLTEIVIRDTPLDVTQDPSTYGHGLLAIDGIVTLHGTPKTAFLRLGVEPNVGDLTLTFTQEVLGWQPGDTLVIPDTRQCCDGPDSFKQIEKASVHSVQGAVVTLATPLQFAHTGARKPDGTSPIFPHVFNLSRDLLLRSANPSGIRGHLLMTGLSTVDIRYLEVRDIGRTVFAPLDSTTTDAQGRVLHQGVNQQGRYGIHMHHLTTPTFTLTGNVAHNTGAVIPYKWGFGVHDSKKGRITDNVAHNVAGAGFAFEDGDGAEDDNILERNGAILIAGFGCSRADVCFPGREGSGFWFRGTNNHIVGNVAVNAGFQGYTFFGGGPFKEFRDNETYGTRNGMTIWGINGAGTSTRYYDAPQSTIKDFTAWHTWEHGVGMGYDAYNVTFDGLIVRGDPRMAGQASTGWSFGDYTTKGFIIRNADISGMRNGIIVSSHNVGVMTIENSTLQNYWNITNETTGAPGGIGHDLLQPRRVNVRNVQFRPLPGVQIRGNMGEILPQRALTMGYRLWGSNTNVILTDELFVYDFQGVVGDNFQVFYTAQAPSAIVPQTGQMDGLTGAPVAGLTNAQTWQQYGLAIAGAVAPCAMSLPDIDGFVCHTEGNPVPPPVVIPPPVVVPPPPPPMALPVITVQPQAQIATMPCAGGTKTFTFSATGEALLLPQWTRNGVDIPGGRGWSYTTGCLTTHDDGDMYGCRVANPAGLVSCLPARLTVQ